MVSAPRPASPPVKRVTATRDEEDNALEYGLPSSHTLNTVCLSGYLLFFVLSMFYFKQVSLVITRVWVVKTLASQRSLMRKLLKEAS